MLIAEIHGKTCPEVLNNEDYLTSAVFGHLRYVPPQHFWQTLFGAAKSSESDEHLTSVLPARVDTYRRLDVHFWKSHKMLGQPDLVLKFSEGHAPDLLIVVEVKLWAGKSGSGEADQLVRYAQLLDDFLLPGVEVKRDSIRLLIFLTPRDSKAEIEESLAVSSDESIRQRLFRLQWQDVLKSCEMYGSCPDRSIGMILSDVREFLLGRGLAYFGGFRRWDDDGIALEVQPDEGHFYKIGCRSVAGFGGMQHSADLENVTIQHGGWTR